MSKAATKRVSRVAMSVAALGVATTVAGVAATQPASISTAGRPGCPDRRWQFDAPRRQRERGLLPGHVQRTAVQTPAATSCTSTSSPAHSASTRHCRANAGDETNAVLASGWGAANASLLLMRVQAQEGPRPRRRPSSSWTTTCPALRRLRHPYPWFALIGVNPLPSPTDTDAAGVVDVGYEYDYNSNAPADVLNPVAAVNSLVAYLYRHLNQDELDLPVNPDGSPAVTCGTANTCGITDSRRRTGMPRRAVRHRAGGRPRRRIRHRAGTPPTSPTQATACR